MRIAQHDYWPGITPLNVGDMRLGDWLALALSCDALTKKRKQHHREMQSKSRVRRAR